MKYYYFNAGNSLAHYIHALHSCNNSPLDNLVIHIFGYQCIILVYIIAWLAVVLGINSTSNAGSNFHEAKPSAISCIMSAINGHLAILLTLCVCTLRSSERIRGENVQREKYLKDYRGTWPWENLMYICIKNLSDILQII